MLVGFSTGSLALGNVRLGLQMVRGHSTMAIELSALREGELVPLVESLDSLDLRQFSYVSFHAPSRLRTLPEATAVAVLRRVALRGWPIVTHPDVITEAASWRQLGDRLCLENMDKRKPIGRTAKELAALFERFPDACLCFDIGHARQVDPTMSEAEAILRRFRSRIRQIHLSLVNSSSVHEPLNYESLLAYGRVSHLLPRDVPIILETPVRGEQIDFEMKKARMILEDATVQIM
jgi:hypothetical protein